MASEPSHESYDDLLRTCRILAALVRNENTTDDLADIADREYPGVTDDDLDSIRRVAHLLLP